MKIVLISLFTLLLIYLIMYMVGGASDKTTPDKTPGTKKSFKSALILEALSTLNDAELYRLKDDLQDIKALLDKNQPYYLKGRRRKGVFPKVDPARTLGKLSGRELLKKIRREIRRMDRQTYRKRTDHFSKIRIILVQILLVLITVLMIII